MSSFASAIAEATALQARSSTLVAEICKLQTQVAAVQPLVQEFRAATAMAVVAASSVPPRPTHVGNHIVRAGSTSTSYRGSLTIKIPE